MARKLDPALEYQQAEERLCTCGATGSGEGHTPWCDWTDQWKFYHHKYFGDDPRFQEAENPATPPAVTP